MFLPRSLTVPLLPPGLCFCCTTCDETKQTQMNWFYRRGFADMLRKIKRRKKLIKLTQICQSCCHILQLRKYWAQSLCLWWGVGGEKIQINNWTIINHTGTVKAAVEIWCFMCLTPGHSLRPTSHSGSCWSGRTPGLS